MRAALFIDGPFVAGVDVHDQEWTAAEGTGKIPMPDALDEMVGWRAICNVGCNDKTKLLKSRMWQTDGQGATLEYIERQALWPFDNIKNSWGKGWGATIKTTELPKGTLTIRLQMNDHRLNSALPTGSAFVPKLGLRAKFRMAVVSSRMKAPKRSRPQCAGSFRISSIIC